MPAGELRSSLRYVARASWLVLRTWDLLVDLRWGTSQDTFCGTSVRLFCLVSVSFQFGCEFSDKLKLNFFGPRVR